MSNADELLKYKELLDNEIITKEEFEQKKRELLNSKPKILENSSQSQNKPVNNIKNKKNSSANTYFRAIFIACIGFIIFLVIVGTLTSEDSNEKNKNLLVNQYNLSTENAENVIDIINQCGYNDYYSGYVLEKGIDNEEIDGSIGFEIQKR